MINQTLDKISSYLLESEEFANDFLPIKDVLSPIQSDLSLALKELQEKSAKATDLEDKVFYINRYTDLVKKVEGIFDVRSKRLQQTLSMLSKISISDNSDASDVDNTNSDSENDKPLTPEKANAILKILNGD